MPTAVPAAVSSDIWLGELSASGSMSKLTSNSSTSVTATVKVWVALEPSLEVALMTMSWLVAVFVVEAVCC